LTQPFSGQKRKISKYEYICIVFKDTEKKCSILDELARWLERLVVNAKVATVLGSISTLEFEGRQMKQC
jgi:hypothetical protein